MFNMKDFNKLSSKSFIMKCHCSLFQAELLFIFFMNVYLFAFGLID